MRAMLCRRHGGPDALDLADVPEPEPGACGIRVRVHAAGVNFADVLMVGGTYQERPPLPFIPGLEVAGVVDAVGVGAGDIRPGQRVLAVLDRGGFADMALARVDDVVPLPDGLGDNAAAGFAIAYGTAYGALRWRADLHAGETVLVHGAAGGVGLATVEVAKALGAVVIATARGRDRLELARTRGADHVLDGGSPTMKEEVRELTAGRGADVVVDPVGGALFETSLRCTAWEGRIVTVGFASGRVPQIPANVLLVKNVSVHGFYWGSYRKHDPERWRDGLLELLGWHGEGRLRPEVTEALPLAEAGEALRRLAERRASGKLVVTP